GRGFSNPGRSFGNNYGRSYGHYNSGSRFYGHGRISRVVPYRGGYHVFLGGYGYPFFVPYRYYDPFRFLIGLFVGFNAFYDPLGYYDIYGPPSWSYGYPTYYGGYRDRDDDRSYLRGTVESIDLHTGLIVIREEGRSRTTIAMLPPRDRRVDDIR